MEGGEVPVFVAGLQYEYERDLHANLQYLPVPTSQPT
jgi:hypothetical protein